MSFLKEKADTEPQSRLWSVVCGNSPRKKGPIFSIFLFHCVNIPIVADVTGLQNSQKFNSLLLMNWYELFSSIPLLWYVHI